MLKIDKRSCGGKAPSPDIWKSWSEKYEEVSLSDQCVDYVKDMKWIFPRISLYGGCVVIERSVLHIVHAINEKKLCNILDLACWVDKVIIEETFIEPRKRLVEYGYKENQINRLEMSSEVYVSETMTNLVGANQKSITYLKYFCPIFVLPNLITFEHNSARKFAFDFWHSERKYPKLRKLIMPENSFRLWQINESTGAVRASKNSEFYAFVRGTALKYEAMKYTWLVLRRYRCPKDLFGLIVPLVGRFDSKCWKEAVYGEMEASNPGWRSYRHKPDNFDLLHSMTKAVKDNKRARQECEKTIAKYNHELSLLEDEHIERSKRLKTAADNELK